MHGQRVPLSRYARGGSAPSTARWGAGADQRHQLGTTGLFARRRDPGANAPEDGAPRNGTHFVKSEVAQ